MMFQLEQQSYSVEVCMYVREKQQKHDGCLDIVLVLTRPLLISYFFHSCTVHAISILVESDEVSEPHTSCSCRYLPPSFVHRTRQAIRISGRLVPLLRLLLYRDCAMNE